MTTASDLIIAELLAIRSCLSALARETLLRQGSDAFVHAEAQAKKFAETAAHSAGRFDEAILTRAVRIVSDIFHNADNV